jgi:hypothetical protein
VEAVVEAGENLPKGMVQAVTENYLKVRIDYREEKAPAPGSLVRCLIAEIAESGNYDALAEKISPCKDNREHNTYGMSRAGFEPPTTALKEKDMP